MVLYAVWINLDKGEYDYVRETEGNSWTQHSPVKTFPTLESAQKECSKWNTGEVVEYSSTDKIYGVE